MKKIQLVIFLFFVFFFSSFARKNKLFGWFHITPKFGIGTAVLANQYMFDFSDVNPQPFNAAYMFGGQIGATFMDQYDLSFELGQQVMNQSYEVNTGQVRYDKDIKFIGKDYGFVFRFIGETGYGEIGTMYSKVNEIVIKNTVNSFISGASTDFIDQRDYFHSDLYKLIIGGGVTVAQVDLFEITAGIRFKVGLQPLLTGPEMPLNDNIYNGVLSDQVKSRDMSLIFSVDLHGFIGFFGKSICGSRRILFFRKPKTLW